MFKFLKRIWCDHDYAVLRIDYYWKCHIFYGKTLKVERIVFICTKCGKKKIEERFIHPMYYTEREMDYMR